MASDATISDVVNIIMATSNEYGSWSQQYDSARLEVSALIIAIVGAGTGFAISSRRKDVRSYTLIAVIVVGLLLTALSVQYLRLYLETASVQSKLRQLATEYVTGEKQASTFNECKIVKKIYQARLEAFDISFDKPEAGFADDCAEQNSMQRQYRSTKTLWPAEIIERTLLSTWFILNIIYSIIVPGLCFIFKINRAHD